MCIFEQFPNYFIKINPRNRIATFKMGILNLGHLLTEGPPEQVCHQQRVRMFSSHILANERKHQSFKSTRWKKVGQVVLLFFRSNYILMISCPILSN